MDVRSRQRNLNGPPTSRSDTWPAYLYMGNGTVLSRPTSDQTFDTGQRGWLYHREGTGSREWVPYCHDLWLTFEREGILRTWVK